MEIISGNKFQQILSDHWEDFYKLNHHRIQRDSIPININKIISCGKFLGHDIYLCNICHKVKKVYFTCKSRFCSRCGKKATDQWTLKNSAILPNTKWQHITFTMPDVLWDFFWYNRYLFNHISNIAAKVLMQIADSKNIMLGIFAALHTFGREGYNNVHMHVSTTCGGITKDTQKWRKIYFHEKSVKKI